MNSEFKDLEDFIKQYSIYPNSGRYLPDYIFIYYGVEFIHHGKYYRFARGPIEFKEAPVLANGKTAQFEMAEILTDQNTYPQSEGYKLIGWYANLQDALENCILEGVAFKDIIISPETEIVGQD